MNDKNRASSPSIFASDIQKNNSNLWFPRASAFYFGDHTYHTRQVEEVSILNDRLWMTKQEWWNFFLNKHERLF